MKNVTMHRGGKLRQGSLLDIRISKKILVYVQLLYLLTVFFFIGAGVVSYSAVYILDLLNILSILCALKGSAHIFRHIGYWPFYVVLVLCAFLFITDIANLVRIPLVIWAIRNTFRFFGFFIACVVLLDAADIDRIMKVFLVFQLANCVISAYQFFVLGIRQDNLGGIFGTDSGCNGYSNIFFCFLLTYYGLRAFSGRGSMGSFFFTCISTLLLAALAELKFYFFEFAALIVVIAFINRKNVRTYGATLLAVIIFFVGLQAFAAVFPQSYATLLDPDAVFQYSSQGMAGYELSRFGAFGEINSLIFNNDPGRELFGIGFGNAEYSSTIPMFRSAFYNIWGSLNYRWFSHQMWYIETGAVGFSLFVSVFVSHAIYSAKLIKRIPQQKLLLEFAVVASFITIVNLWYNCTIRIEAGYLTFFFLSISCIVAKESFRTRSIHSGGHL